jgi:CTP:molybdopterin cytidylyltransferase MocA
MRSGTNRLIAVQGVFFALGDTPQVDPAELQDELVAMAKIARKKA